MMASQGKSEASKYQGIPVLLNAWRGLDKALPRVFLGKLDVSLTILSAMVLTCLRFVVEAVQTNVFDWPVEGRQTCWAASCIVSMCHSIILVASLYFCLMSHRYQPSEKIEQSPHWLQESVHCLLQFCTGYMLYDGLMSYVFMNWETGMDATSWCILGHHVATTLYMTSVRVVGAGHMSAMILMFLGEITNPFQSGRDVALTAMELSCCNGPKMQQFLYVDTFLFALTYFVIRGFIAPVAAVHIIYDFLTSGRKHIPITLLCLWIFLMMGVLLGSLPWVEDCWSLLQDYIPMLRNSMGQTEL